MPVQHAQLPRREWVGSAVALASVPLLPLAGVVMLCLVLADAFAGWPPHLEVWLLGVALVGLLAWISVATVAVGVRLGLAHTRAGNLAVRFDAAERWCELDGVRHDLTAAAGLRIHRTGFRWRVDVADADGNVVLRVGDLRQVHARLLAADLAEGLDVPVWSSPPEDASRFGGQPTIRAGMHSASITLWTLPSRAVVVVLPLLVLAPYLMVWMPSLAFVVVGICLSLVLFQRFPRPIQLEVAPDGIRHRPSIGAWRRMPAEALAPTRIVAGDNGAALVIRTYDGAQLDLEGHTVAELQPVADLVEQVRRDRAAARGLSDGAEAVPDELADLLGAARHRAEVPLAARASRSESA